MRDIELVKAWSWLVVLGAATTGLTFLGAAGLARLGVGFLILVMAGWKARIILRQYLGLHKSAFWRNGFEAFLIVFLIAAFALFAWPWGEGNA